MSRTTNLSSKHYASKWKIPAEGELNDRETVNKLAIAYATSPDGPEREEKCLAIVQCFHGYIMKYLNMIVRGHLPSLKTPAGKEASKMLSTLVPRGKKATRETLGQACRTLHLAFKQMSADDVYDTLVICIMRAIRKYDPYYTIKVKEVCELIDANYRKRGRGAEPVIAEPDISRALGFDSLSYIRLLVRRGHLESVAGPKKKVVGYRRTKTWPPEPEFFESGPVGFVYFLPMYFRYYLHEFISSSMSAIEAKEGMLQLDHWNSADVDSGSGFGDRGTPHAEGNITDSHGSTWAADITLMTMSLDISTMSLEWVQETKDKLFRKLTVQERYLLYLIFVKEMKWVEIAAILDLDITTAKKMFEQVMIYLKARAKS